MGWIPLEKGPKPGFQKETCFWSIYEITVSIDKLFFYVENHVSTFFEINLSQKYQGVGLNSTFLYTTFSELLVEQKSNSNYVLWIDNANNASESLHENIDTVITKVHANKIAHPT